MVAIAQLNTHVACPIRGVSFEAQIVGEDVSAHETPTIGDTMATPQARGVIYVHSAPRALCPHLEWAAGRALGDVGLVLHDLPRRAAMAGAGCTRRISASITPKPTPSAIW